MQANSFSVINDSNFNILFYYSELVELLFDIA